MTDQPNDRERCRVCGVPEATDDDLGTVPDGETGGLCWALRFGSEHTAPPIDVLDLLAERDELEAKVREWETIELLAWKAIRLLASVTHENNAWDATCEAVVGEYSNALAALRVPQEENP